MGRIVSWIVNLCDLIIDCFNSLRIFRAGLIFGICWAVILLPPKSYSQEPVSVQVEKLFKLGQTLSDQTHYLEALDLFQEARDMLEEFGQNGTAMYADLLFAQAQAKIKGRIHQDFSAYYVKSALQDIQAANKLRERLTGILPQKLAEGYYLEGYIHKKVFLAKKIKHWLVL